MTATRRPRLATRDGALLLLLLLVVVVTAASPAPASSARAATSHHRGLGARLLRIGQLPGGWEVNAKPGNGVGCLSGLLQPQGLVPTASVRVSFDDKGNLPEVVERLAAYRHPRTAYRRVLARLAACTTLDGVTDGQTVTGTVVPITLARFGTASTAYLATFTVEHESLAEDFLVVRQGGVILGVSEGDFAPADTVQFQAFARIAVSDLAAG